MLSADSRVRDTSAVHPENASAPTDTADPAVTDESTEHPENDPSGMPVSPAAEKDSREAQPLKA